MPAFGMLSALHPAPPADRGQGGPQRKPGYGAPDSVLASRTSSAQYHPVALAGTATLTPAESVQVDAIVVGAYAQGDSRWLHLKNGVGFIPLGATAGL